MYACVFAYELAHSYSIIYAGYLYCKRKVIKRHLLTASVFIPLLLLYI